MQPTTDTCVHGRSLTINGVPMPVWAPSPDRRQIYVWTTARAPLPLPRSLPRPPLKPRQQYAQPPPTLLHPTPLRPAHPAAVKRLENM